MSSMGYKHRLADDKGSRYKGKGVIQFKVQLLWGENHETNFVRLEPGTSRSALYELNVQCCQLKSASHMLPARHATP
jgi:hypothetical protein